VGAGEEWHVDFQRAIQGEDGEEEGSEGGGEEGGEGGVEEDGGIDMSFLGALAQPEGANMGLMGAHDGLPPSVVGDRGM